MEIAEIIFHPDWDCRDPANTPDIALVRLKHPLDLTKHTLPCFHSWKKWEFFGGKFRNLRTKNWRGNSEELWGRLSNLVNKFRNKIPERVGKVWKKIKKIHKNRKAIQKN